MKQLIALLLWGCFLSPVRAEDGSRLWLSLPKENIRPTITTPKSTPTIDLAAGELRKAWLGAPVVLNLQKNKETQALGEEGFLIRTSGTQITITSLSEAGLLYGAYHLLRLQDTGADCSSLNITERPSYNVRILNHWDNLDRTVERGYAGRSLWIWDELPAVISPRYEQYARANASIGINATVVNNVNASPQILSADYLKKVKALADIFRPYRLKIYLAINFSSPAELGGLPTSDPLNKEVQKWWKDKVKEVYTLIPDFGGFLVKANSEGLPGPQDFGRTHVDGANMLADALKPYKGIVMWRAFVYSPGDEDRAKQAYQEFMPFDGKFRDNVIIQIKNGPVDFQPREPFSPLLGAMKQTPVMAEFQITQEYLGFSNHLCYLAPMWKECLDSDTYQLGEGSTIARLTNGELYKYPITAMAGVANIGDEENWCGHPFAQSNWYAFGRLAWNPHLTSATIADEWIRQTFASDPDFREPVKEMMLQSREAVVDYMMPLGLHHLFAFGHHYGPEPWCAVAGARADWLPSYYHKADATGLGFDRSSTGSHATAQYHSPLCDTYDRLETCPENLLLWFHHVPWTYPMKSGRTLWDELCYTYDRGVQQARKFQQVWDATAKYVDAQRFAEVQHKLRIQTRDAVWWKDACLLYFQQFSQRPIPYSIERPVHNLPDMMQYRIRITNYECPPYGFTK